VRGGWATVTNEGEKPPAFPESRENNREMLKSGDLTEAIYYHRPADTGCLVKPPIKPGEGNDTGRVDPSEKRETQICI